MIVFMAFTRTMAQEFGSAPAPSPSMESAGMALQVPALLAAIVSFEFAAAPAPSPSMESAGMALQVPAALAGIVSLVAYLF
nr:MLO-related protein [Tanacetum cinerariifolium]